MKYDFPGNQNEPLSNIPGLQSVEDIELSEFEGFLSAEILLTESVTNKTKFTAAYILRIHKMALGHLYSFAGKYRDVNISKGGFTFPASRFLPASMATFEREVLQALPNKYSHKEELIKDIAMVHGELLFIHPFREGNGRTARVLANIMCRKQGYGPLRFGLITEKEFDDYVLAVQLSAGKDYEKMEKIVRLIFPG